MWTLVAVAGVVVASAAERIAFIEVRVTRVVVDLPQ
jgi:hypothetical protein